METGAKLVSYLSKHFKDSGGTIELAPDGPFKPYDLIVTKGQSSFKIECKYDLLMSKTGNHAIEFWRGDSKSGIAATESDYWCVANTTEDKVYLFDTNRLKELCQKEKFPIVSGSDGMRAKMFLVKFGQLKNMLRPIEINLHCLNIPF